jgi:hypothetical protein
VYGRYTGRQAFAANLEYRQDILNFGDFGAISAIGFLDAGMVQEDKELESNKLHVGLYIGQRRLRFDLSSDAEKRAYYAAPVRYTITLRYHVN